MNKNNLAGISLKLEYITRTNMFDAQVVCACDNCGQAIINLAHVIDPNGKSYVIGLDCKKKLIDKPHMDALKSSGEFMKEYQAKEYNSGLNTVNKFLTLCSNPENEIEIDYKNREIIIRDKKELKNFPGSGLTGNTLFYESIGYLTKLGLGKFIEDLNKSLNRQ